MNAEDACSKASQFMRTIELWVNFSFSGKSLSHLLAELCASYQPRLSWKDNSPNAVSLKATGTLVYTCVLCIKF